MIKPKKLQKGDKIAIVSLSSGILGEDFCRHELEIALNRLKCYGLIPVVMPNALKGIEYLKNHPEKRADDLKSAFSDKDIQAVICSIGGDDTYKLTPYLMNDKEFIENVRKHPKIFTGFSDTTINHLMFHKIGMSTFYGPNILCDLAELDNDMLSYTKEYFELFFNCSGSFEIKSADTVYFDSFPIKDIVLDIVGDEETANKIVEAVGDVSYKIGYEPELNTEKDSILFVLDPKPLELNVSIPSETEGGEAQNLHIEVKVSPVDGANYEVETTNLKFKIYVPEVSLGEGDNEPVALPGFVPATFDFELKKN